MIRPMLQSDAKVQVGEKIRISGLNSFVTEGEAPITAIEFRADASEPWISVSDLLDKETWFLDWVYDVVGTKVPEMRMTGGTIVSQVGSIEVVTADSEKLFADDSDLVPQENDILKYIPQGRSTWNFVHRRVQHRIMEELDKQRILNEDGSRITLEQVLDKSQFVDWAIYMALAMIYEQLSRSVDDIFQEKQIKYERKQFEYMNFCMNLMRVDINKDGELTREDEKQFRSTVLVKR